MAVVCLAIGGLAGAGLVYRADLTIPTGMAGKHMDVAGIPLRVLQEGRGRDILMIHGSPGLLEDFDAVEASLRDSFRITRYDRPGHGYSGDSGQYSHEANAREALALIEQLGLERVVVVGHSYGGSTALALAAMKSPRVSSIVVLDSAVYAPVRPVKSIFRWLRLPTIGIGLAELVPASNREKQVADGLRDEFKVAMPPEPFLSMHATALSQPKVLHAIANEHWAYADQLAALSKHYADIEVPVHIVSQRDDPGRAAQAERLAREVKRGDVKLVSPSGHFVQFEQTAVVSEVIRRVAETD